MKERKIFFNFLNGMNHKFTIIMAVALLCIVILFLLWAAAPALAVAVPVEIEDGIRWAGCPLSGELQDALPVNREKPLLGLL